MICVVIESPLKGHVPAWVPAFLAPIVERWNRARNKRYARACMRDSLKRGEAPYASHLLYDQRGVLDDANAAEREQGIAAGLANGDRCDLRAVYIDLGRSPGMTLGVLRARELRQRVVYRTLSHSRWALVRGIYEAAGDTLEGPA